MLTRTDPLAQERTFGSSPAGEAEWAWKLTAPGRKADTSRDPASTGRRDSLRVLEVFFLLRREHAEPGMGFRPQGVMGLEIRKVFRAGNSLVISLPRAAMADMGLQEGSRVIVTVERGRRAIIIEPLQEDLLEIAREVIDEYRPFVAGGHAAGRPFS